jgi:hypothetical protein
MEFDHKPGTKLFKISAMAAKSLREVLAEVAKCDVVCANCHKERTHARRVVDSRERIVTAVGG